MGAYMSDKRKQHYVPQFYMKAFTNGENKFYVYQTDKDKMIDVPVFYGNQCQKKYFYGEDGVWENKLALMEQKWAKVIKKIIHEQDLDSDDKKSLKEFAVYQRQRTYAEEKYREQERIELLIECGKMLYFQNGWQFDEEAEKICRERVLNEKTPAENLELAMKITSYIEDLDVLIIHYNTKNELISSDVPVIAINPFYSPNIGYSVIGLVMFFPISTHKLVVIYDAKMYTRYKQMSVIESNDEEEVKNLNAYQFIAAEELIFSHRANEILEVDDCVKQARKDCRSHNVNSTLGPEGQKLIISGMRKVQYDCVLSFAMLPHRYKRIPFSCREAVPRKREVEWEDKLKIKEKIMPEVWKSEPNMTLRSGLSKKELKMGCKKMTLAAQLYWNQNE
jgi:hypothetical protein